MADPKRIKWYWTLPLGLALLVNVNVLANGFGWDDQAIVNSFEPPTGWQDLFFPAEPPAYSAQSAYLYFRPMVHLSYWADHWLWEKNPFGFHFSVWVFHGLNTVLVYFLTQSLAGDGRRDKVLWPLAASVLFAVHPAHAEAVSWIAGRNDVLCAAFMLGSMILYLKFLSSRHPMFYGLTLAAFLVALLTKETALGLLFLFPLLDLWKRSESAVRIRPVHLLRFAGFMGVSVLYFWMRSGRLTLPPGSRGMEIHTSIPSVLDIIRAYGFYFKMMGFPFPPQPFISHIPSTPGMTGLGAAVILLFLFCLVRSIIWRETMTGFPLAWTVFLLAPPAAVAAFPVAATIGAERYIYAPSAGFLIGVAGLIITGLETIHSRWGASLPQKNAFLFLGGMVLLGWWSWERWERNAQWKNPHTFWEAAVRAAPEAGLPHRLLGLAYLREDRKGEAELELNSAIQLFQDRYGPDHLAVGDASFDLAVLYQTQGRISQAEFHYRRAAGIYSKTFGPDHPDLARSLHGLGLLYVAEGNWAGAEPFLGEALNIYQKALPPGDERTIRLMEGYAEVLRKLGRTSEAMEIGAQQRSMNDRKKIKGRGGE